MDSISLDEFNQLIAGADVLTRDRRGVKVYRCPDGNIVKLFRLKRLFSSALLYPYVKRFSRGVKELEARAIPTVKVIGVARVRGLHRDMVHYRALEGVTLSVFRCGLRVVGG